MTISAKIIADSITVEGKRITTFELEYPRFILAELNTHRLLSRNSSSSRAITVKKNIETIINDTAMPSHWGKNQPGMSAKEECDNLIYVDSECQLTRENWWFNARDAAIDYAQGFEKSGYHKQIVNRLLEPFSHMKTVVTGTELENFFWLRDHEDAQPEIHILASRMKQAMDNSIPTQLGVGDWHVPYYFDGCWREHIVYEAPIVSDETFDRNGFTLKEAIAISASQCAQVSYRKTDDSLEKAEKIYERLVHSFPPHFSPMEHQATPMKVKYDESGLPIVSWDVGITHMDRYNNMWSGNFKGWIQNRQLMMNDLKLKSMTSVPFED